MLREIEYKGVQEIAEQLLDYLQGMDANETIDDLSDLHNEVYNMDYFTESNYNAERFLEENIGVFNAINLVKDYEQDSFGEVFTDISSPMLVCNMIAYIAGQEIIYDNLEDGMKVKRAIKTIKKEFDL